MTKLELFFEKIAETEQEIAHKRRQLETVNDPLARNIVERSVKTLQEILLIYLQAAQNLVAIRKTGINRPEGIQFGGTRPPGEPAASSKPTAECCG